MSDSNPFFIDTAIANQFARVNKHPFLRLLLNIALASLMAFAVVGSAACALRLVFLH
jgi:hypothetical protein